jgi:hypothetical protein
MESRRIEVPGGHVSAAIAFPDGYVSGSAPVVLLAHGAGSDMHHPFLVAMQTGLSAAGYVAVAFNFPYREAGRRIPDARPVLERCYRAVLDAVVADPSLAPPWVVIGGRSMGGRMATYLAAAGARVRGVLLLGYPLHPAGKPDALRADHLSSVRIPMLFVQGTRDALAGLARLGPVLASLPNATLHLVEDGDHSFKVPRRTGRSEADVRADILSATVEWLGGLDGRERSDGAS